MFILKQEREFDDHRESLEGTADTDLGVGVGGVYEAKL